MISTLSSHLLEVTQQHLIPDDLCELTFQLEFLNPCRCTVLQELVIDHLLDLFV